MIGAFRESSSGLRREMDWVVEASSEGSLAAVVRPHAGAGNDLEALIGQNRSATLDTLYRRGALLFRGYDVGSTDKFGAVARAFSEKSFSYIGGASPRTRVQGAVFTSTELTSEAKLMLHNEASYFPELPDFVWFYCAIPAGVGGETPLGDMRRVLSRLNPDLVGRFAEKGVMYVSNLHGGKGFGKSWQATYQSEDRDEVEQRLREKGAEFSWSSDGQLRVIMRAPGVRRHSVTGEDYWGNQAASFHTSALPEKTASAMHQLFPDPMSRPTMTFYGDGSPIDDDDVRSIVAALSAEETTFRWRENDVLLVDNQAIAHGRNPFRGERRILVVLE